MSKLYIFGIGGTGSRVLRSFTMMMAAGVELGKDIDTVVPIIIDPDAANADVCRTVSLMGTYSNIRSKLSFTPANTSQFFRTELRQISQNYTMQILNTNNKEFRRFIDISTMDRPTQAMMKMLFSDKNLNANMEVGFKGNPNIGSVVLNQIVASPDFDAFANSFEQGDKIFIVSSIFGGTGASGFPLLLKTLRTGNNFPNHQIINDAAVGAITVLPYFQLKKSGESEIDSSTFISKAKAALAYYEGNIDIDELYFLGDDATGNYDNHEGGIDQKNDAHLIEFLASTAILDFCKEQHPAHVSLELGLKDEAAGSVTFGSFYDVQREPLFAPLTRFMMMANCLNHKYDYYSSADFNANSEAKYFGGIYHSPFMTNLRQMLDLYKDWLREMKSNNRSLDLYNLDGADKPLDIVTGLQPKKSGFITFKKDYDLVTEPLNNITYPFFKQFNTVKKI